MSNTWKYRPDDKDAHAGCLTLDDRPILMMKSCGPGHIIDTGALIAQCLTRHWPGMLGAAQRYEARPALPEHPMDVHWVVVDTKFGTVKCDATKMSARQIAASLNGGS